MRNSNAAPRTRKPKSPLAVAVAELERTDRSLAKAWEALSLLVGDRDRIAMRISELTGKSLIEASMLPGPMRMPTNDNDYERTIVQPAARLIESLTLDSAARARELGLEKT